MGCALPISGWRDLHLARMYHILRQVQVSLRYCLPAKLGLSNYRLPFSPRS
jgi:hypothetical protein